MKQKTLIILLILFAVCVVALVGCNTNNTPDGVKVTYMLEGGTYQNGEDVVYQYYNFAEGTQNLIKPLQDFVQSTQLTKDGCYLEGWYRTKNSDDTYSDKWNFATDRVGDEGVTLYACWKLSVAFVYNVYDFDNPDVLIKSTQVNEGIKFNDRYASRSGYTVVALFDAEGNAWDYNFAHPGSAAAEEGSTEVVVKVYAKYVLGSYTIVKDVAGLKSAVALKSNIYLANDLDLAGASLGYFSGNLLGNGHTISNFKLDYSSKNADLIVDPDDDSKKSLALSLFGNIDGVEIKDVTFVNVQIEVNTSNSIIYKIYISPLATVAQNTTVENVTVKGTVTVTKVPATAEIVCLLENAFCFAEHTSVTNFVSQLVLEHISEE